MNFAKVMVLGEIGVGKTSLVRRLIDDKFQTDYSPTIGVDIYKYDLTLAQAGGETGIEMAIWDTDGDFGDSIFRYSYVDQADGALIVGEVEKRHTQDTMLGLARAFFDNLPGRPISFVLNKLDLMDGAEPAGLPAELAGSRQLVNTSAKTGSNVKQAFNDIAAAIIRARS